MSDKTAFCWFCGDFSDVELTVWDVHPIRVACRSVEDCERRASRNYLIARVFPKP